MVSDTGSARGFGELAHVFLLPGRIHCAVRPSLVTTVLGSCVSVCVTDRARGVSGINHFLLPSYEGGEANPRYGDVAIQRLLTTMRRICGPRARLEAKVFGGAEVLHGMAPGGSVGARNVAAALEQLARLEIPVIAQRTGDRHGLLIKLVTPTGEVFVRPVASHNVSARKARPR